MGRRHLGLTLMLGLFVLPAFSMPLWAQSEHVLQRPPAPGSIDNGPQIEDAAVRRLLDKNGFALGQRTYRQIFTPYLDSDEPVFITSDVVLAAFNHLLRASMTLYEETSARRLPEILRLMWSQLTPVVKPPGEREDHSAANGGDAPSADEIIHAAARSRARLVLAVALRLCGEDRIELEGGLRRLVDAEVIRVERAEGRLLPDWFGTADDMFNGLDYNRFAPSGFYNRSERLRRYYRAVRWLQSIPFRIDRDEELLAILILGKTLISHGYEKDFQRRRVQEFYRIRRQLTSTGSDRDILLAADIMRDRPTDLQTVRSYLQALPSAGMDVPVDRAVSGLFFLMAPGDGPDALERLAREGFDSGSTTPPLGLMMCAALGSNFARDRLGNDARSLDAKADTAEARFDAMSATDSVYSQYLRCLAALVDGSEPDAPGFMTAPAWQIKNCNTVLSGWVQFRRVAPGNVERGRSPSTPAMVGMPAGFVEPAPEFFDRLAELIDFVRDIFVRSGAFIPPREFLAKDLRILARRIEQQRSAMEKNVTTGLPPIESAAVTRAVTVLRVIANLQLDSNGTVHDATEMAGHIRGLADELAAGEFDGEPSYEALVVELNVDLERLWMMLSSMSLRLEIMAHKQLRGVRFTEKDQYFLADFGIQLAAVMHSAGGTVAATDDSPLVAAYAAAGPGDSRRLAAVARPRELLVRYPFGGALVRCRGAVMPYHEFSAGGLLTDGEWRRRLDSDEHPPLPYWLEPIGVEGPPHRPGRDLAPFLPAGLR